MGARRPSRWAFGGGGYFRCCPCINNCTPNLPWGQLDEHCYSAWRCGNSFCNCPPLQKKKSAPKQVRGVVHAQGVSLPFIASYRPIPVQEPRCGARVKGAGLLHTEPEEGGIVGRSEFQADLAVDHRYGIRVQGEGCEGGQVSGLKEVELQLHVAGCIQSYGVIR